MPEKIISIPVKHFRDESGSGITIEKIFLDNLSASGQATANDDEAGDTHRHDRHSFFLLETGTIFIEIDFQKYEIKSPSIIYVHPDQVHRTFSLENITVSCLAINNKNLNPEYLELLEEITPAKAVLLEKDNFSIIYEAVTLCLKFSERKNDKLYHSLLKDSCNALVALFISQYPETKSAYGFSRVEMITKNFKKLLEGNFTTMKSPAKYAQKLNISTPYLNECVKKATGYSVSHHIQQRIILEAKRLLCHCGKSVKEIAFELGYDNYPYFSRLFTNVSKMTPLAFRNKNRD